MRGPAPLLKGSGAALTALLLALLLPSGALAFGPLSSFGAFGDGAGELTEPAGVAIGGDGTAYVADAGNDRIVVFAPGGAFSREIGVGSLEQPRGIALGPGGRLYVADTGGRRVAVFAPGGGFLFAFDEEGAMVEPVGVAFGPDRLLFVADRGAHRVSAFTAEGEFVRAFGEEGTGTGQLSGPSDVGTAPDGSLAVADRGNNRVAVFSAAGEFLHAFGEDVQAGGGPLCTDECQAGVAGTGAGAVSAPESIAIDADGVVHVGESGNFRVSRFDLDGAFVDAFGEGVVDGAPAFQICTAAKGCQQGGVGTERGAVNEPTGIAFDCRGAVYVAEQALALARVERFGAPGTPRCSATVPVEPVRPLRLSAPPPPVALPDSKFQFGKLVLNRRRGTAILFVFVPGPGLLTLGGVDLRTVRRNASRRGGLVRMPVLPVGELKRKLRRKGRAKGRVRVSFKPRGGVARTKRRPILLLRRRG